MSVGSFGTIVFRISRKKVYSFSNFKRTKTAEWKEHIRYKNKPLSEFTGMGLDNITLDVHLDANLGINPRKEIERWGKLLESGHHDVLVIGGQQIGKYEWKLERISEGWNSFLGGGELTTASLTITLSEYIVEAPKKQETVQKKSTVTEKTSVKPLIGSNYKVVALLTGYYTSMEAKNLQAVNRTGKVYPGTYYIFNIANEMINVTKVKGSPGSWINPIKNK